MVRSWFFCELKQFKYMRSRVLKPHMPPSFVFIFAFLHNVVVVLSQFFWFLVTAPGRVQWRGAGQFRRRRGKYHQQFGSQQVSQHNMLRIQGDQESQE
jgi:hypothetical protein